MCGRFYLNADKKQLERGFNVNLATMDCEPRYNITPGQPVLTITEDQQGRQAQRMRWGLIPAWSKGVDTRFSMINARAETIHEKPAYKRPFRRTRCLIPASGFYEWRKEKDSKQPYCITRSDGGLLAFAGVWDHWIGEGQAIVSCSIITTMADNAVNYVHDRMPVVLDEADVSTWLHPDVQDIDRLRGCFSTFNSDVLEYWPVSKAVNSPSNDSSDLISRL